MCAEIPYRLRVTSRIAAEPLIDNAAREICFNPQNWAVTGHQYGVFALVLQTSFRGETSGESRNVPAYSGYATPFIAFVNDLPLLRLLLLLLLLCHMYIASRGDNATHTDPLRVPSGSHSLHM